jgi:hypothetical protein
VDTLGGKIELGLSGQCTARRVDESQPQMDDRIFVIQAQKDGHVPYADNGSVSFSCSRT